MATVRRSSRIPRAALALVGLAALVAGCNPSCDRVCHKVRSCDLSPRLSQDECVESCTREEALYDIWEDDTKREAFVAHKRCLVQATCDELLADDCYDPEIYLF